MAQIDGDLAVLDTPFPYTVYNKFLTNWREAGANVPTGILAGTIFSDSDDDKLYHCIVDAPTGTLKEIVQAGIDLSDGATIGQAAGPLLTFDDTNNFLEITGCKVAIGHAVPDKLVDISSAAYDDYKLQIRGNIAIDGRWIGLAFGHNTVGYDKGGILWESVDTWARGRMHFALDPDGAAGNIGLADSKMFIDYNGDVKIGAITAGNPYFYIYGYKTAVGVKYLRTNVDASGFARIEGEDGITLAQAAGKLGFYGLATPIALQAGVAVNAAAIHAALVALNLITA